MIQLSVIVPVYNTPRQLLEHCISSIKDNIRHLEGAEILCMNDGSTETHVEQMLKEAETADSRFKYVYKPNSGVSDTRNLGIDMAQGEYIVFVDADDYLEPDALSYMLESVEKHDADLAVFGFCYNEKDNLAEERVNKWISGDLKMQAISTQIENNMDSWYEIGVNLASACMKIYKREALLRTRIRFCRDIAWGEDGFFNLCFISAIDKFYVDNRLVYHYVDYEDSATHRFTHRHVTEAINMMPMLEDFVASNYPDNKDFYDAIVRRTYYYVRTIKEHYFTHPKITKSFWELKSEMDGFLNSPHVSKWLKRLKLSDSEDIIDFKNRLLLKLHLYWIFLITERRKRKRSQDASSFIVNSITP